MHLNLFGAATPTGVALQRGASNAFQLIATLRSLVMSGLRLEGLATALAVLL